MPQLEIEYSANLPIKDELSKLAVDLHYVIARGSRHLQDPDIAA